MALRYKSVIDIDLMLRSVQLIVLHSRCVTSVHTTVCLKTYRTATVYMT